MPMNRLRIKFFAAVRERLGVEEMALEVAPGTTAALLLERLRGEYPQAAPLLATVRVAANQEFVEDAHVLGDGDEVAIIPPISGG
ncbi:MAG: molybdopterin converting factor subunit 1 [Planctomycetes bacterium]|nr:molybdopterin converting factor subunit 1 [Planctomycetota bacterium]